MPLSKLLNDDDHSKYFDSQSGRILCKKLLNNTEKHTFLNYTREITDNFITKIAPDRRDFRPKVASQLCTAMMAVKPKTVKENILNARVLIANERKTIALLGSVAASVGDEATHSRAIQGLDALFESDSKIFPSALDAAIATNHLHILREQLKFIDDEIKDMPAARNWKSMRKTAKYIGKALMVAIRLHRNTAGAMLFEFLEKNKDLRDSRHGLLGTWLFQDAVRASNETLMYRALELDLLVGPTKRMIGPQDRCKLKDVHIKFLFKPNNTTILAKLLHDGHILPNAECEGATLLTYALRLRRRGIAQVLLDYGAHVNGLTSKDGVTALWYATKQGYHGDVLFLLQRGATPDYPSTKTRSPLKMAQEYRFNYSKTKWLLEYATTEEGLAFLKESDHGRAMIRYEWKKDDIFDSFGPWCRGYR